MAQFTTKSDPGFSRVGQVGYVIGIGERIVLSFEPAANNKTQEPILSRWCGNYNNEAIEAFGVGRVTRVNGDKLVVRSLDGKPRLETLSDLGWAGAR